MPLTWTPTPDDGARCDTALASMAIKRDRLHSPPRYVASIVGGAWRADLPSIDAAMAWCEREYAALLRREFEGL